VYYCFVFGHGLLFTFTIFPKDVPNSTKEIIDNSVSDRKESVSSNSGISSSKTAEDGQLKCDDAWATPRETTGNELNSIAMHKDKGGTATGR
jgi:hypothetical protein